MSLKSMMTEELRNCRAVEKLKGIVKAMLEKPGIFIFGHVLTLPNVKRLQDHKEFKRHYNTLELFAYGNYLRYAEMKDSAHFIELSPSMIKKLRYLTICDLAAERSCIPYEMLMEKLRMRSVRHLEDLLIEAMFYGVIQGCMQQSNKVLFISKMVARDPARPPAANDDDHQSSKRKLDFPEGRDRTPPTTSKRRRTETVTRADEPKQ